MDHQLGSLRSLFRPKDVSSERNRSKAKNFDKTASANVQKLGSKVIVASHTVRNADAESSQGKLGQAFSNMLVSLKNVVVGNMLPESISPPRFSSGSIQASKRGYGKLLTDMDSPFLSRRQMELTERVPSTHAKPECSATPFSELSRAKAKYSNSIKSTSLHGISATSIVLEAQIPRSNSMAPVLETNNNSTQCSWSPIPYDLDPNGYDCYPHDLVDHDDYSGSELSDDETSWEEDFSCVVCERAFFTARQLERHQIRKRHWGCGECDRRFNSQMLLEYHKEEFNHWSEEDFPYDSEDEDFESLREVMNDVREEETEFGPDEQEKEMLL
ncbi:hypothetical protein TCAL_14229 [Tigriopus californicus]|uniref:C2H2-type domain-containing protein n=1 Tax=Tigriopus californicus TaxID=6832 RepID=A0A553NSU1_TIGCA|nr:uncharacterized protein LOC131886500 [Tigriopus californicus]TRY68506.1 hypothetical protein TCAL_14229 [Tigriopus californicus]